MAGPTCRIRSSRSPCSQCRPTDGNGTPSESNSRAWAAEPWAAATIAGSNAWRAMKTMAARNRPGAKLGSNAIVRSTARSRSSPHEATPKSKMVPPIRWFERGRSTRGGPGFLTLTRRGQREAESGPGLAKCRIELARTTRTTNRQRQRLSIGRVLRTRAFIGQEKCIRQACMRRCVLRGGRDRMLERGNCRRELRRVQRFQRQSTSDPLAERVVHIKRGVVPALRRRAAR